MAQLKEDEWPGDREPTTSEEEAGAFKKEGAYPPGRQTGHSRDELIEVGQQPVEPRADAVTITRRPKPPRDSGVVG